MKQLMVSLLLYAMSFSSSLQAVPGGKFEESTTAECLEKVLM